MGAEIAANPEKIGISSDRLRPASTRTVFLTLPLSVISVSVCRPGVTVGSVTGDSPTALPSSSTLAPAGWVETTICPAVLDGAGVDFGSALDEAVVFGLIGSALRVGQNVWTAAMPIVSTTPAAAAIFHGMPPPPLSVGFALKS